MYRVARHCVRAYNPNSLVCVCVCVDPVHLVCPAQFKRKSKTEPKVALRHSHWHRVVAAAGRKKEIVSDETAIIHNAIQPISLLNTFVCVCSSFLFILFFCCCRPPALLLPVVPHHLPMRDPKRLGRNNQKFLTPFFLLFYLPHRWILDGLYRDSPAL